VDSTLISAPSSTKNAKKERDPEAHSTKKGNNWYFGYKAHISVDKDTGLVHTLRTTAANVHDVTMMPQLLSGEKETVHGDSGYLGAEKRGDAVLRNKDGKKIQYKINRRPSQSKNHSTRSKAQIKRRPLSEQKLSTFSLWSRADSDTERPGTAAYRSRLRN
jgi:IS5 family transposase